MTSEAVNCFIKNTWVFVTYCDTLVQAVIKCQKEKFHSIDVYKPVHQIIAHIKHHKVTTFLYSTLDVIPRLFVLFFQTIFKAKRKENDFARLANIQTYQMHHKQKLCITKKPRNQILTFPKYRFL